MSTKKFFRFLVAGALALSGIIASYTVQSPDSSEASAAAEQAADTSPAGVPGPEELYRKLAESRRMFDEGIRSIREGRRAEGERMTAEAEDRLFSGLRKCTDIDGCDIEVFFDAISDLLEIKQESLAETAEDAAGSPEETASEKTEAESPSRESVSIQPTPSHTLLKGKDLRELIELNEPVKAAMNDWLTWMRPQLMDSYENYQFLRDKIAPIYEEAGLPEALLFAVIATETGGKVHAISKAGAAGLMQFMSQTGKNYGLFIKDGFDLRLDPVEATKANVAFLNEQLENLNHDLEKSLAAYNGGPNRLRRLDRKLKGISFWDSRFYNSLPGETRMYVPRILAAAWLFIHPRDYNLQFEAFPKETVVLKLKRATALDALTICLGQEQQQRNGWFRTLRNLNPQLEYQEPIEAGTEIVIPAILRKAYERNCLEGDLVQRSYELHEARFPEIIEYTVVKGDSLIKIAGRHNCSVQELATINNLRGPNYTLQIGQKLKIPGSR